MPQKVIVSPNDRSFKFASRVGDIYSRYGMTAGGRLSNFDKDTFIIISNEIQIVLISAAHAANIHR